MVPLSRRYVMGWADRRGRRRGVLLLVVLSMLTLFVLLGSTYLVVAIRARRVSQAFANKITAPAAAGSSGARLVDQTLLAVVRGTTSTNAPAALRNGDDLLGDKYGSNTIVGEISGISGYVGSAGFLAVNTANLTVPPTNVTDLAGRIVTLSMPGLTVSTRIVRALGTSPNAPTLVIAAGPTVTDQQLSLASATAAWNRGTGPADRRLIINGREFDDSGTNETWDAFDNENPLLTRVMPNPSSGAPQVLAAPISPPKSLDADRDGVPDTDWLDVGLPPFTDAAGQIVQPKALILVVDLDGRINLNTHGDPGTFDTFDTAFTATLTDADGGDTAYPRYFSPGEIPNNGMDDDGNGITDDPYCWKKPPGGSVATLRSLAPGAGSVTSTSLAKSDAFRPTASSDPRPPQAANADIARDMLHGIAGFDAATNANLNKSTDVLAASRPLPDVGGFEGRYGSGGGWDATFNPDALPRPGRRWFNDPMTEARERWSVALVVSGSHSIAQSYFTHPGRYGTPPDLKGRMVSWADPKSGQSVYYKPYWDQFSRSKLYDNEAVDDPYEVDLTPRGARLAAVRNPGTGGVDVNNPFTVADLEGLLRFYDPDSPRLSRRLVAANGTVASINRMTVTTESWDSTAIMGDAWNEVIGAPFQTTLGNPVVVNDFLAPEIIMGHRLDVNRPFHDPALDEDANDNGVLDPGEDTNGNGILDLAYSEPNDAIGRTHRQQFAKHLYCLLVGIAAKNGLSMPMSADHARRLAQYAVNIVDFRDADSTMTLFRYDPAFTPLSTTWAPGTNDFVWGCERPEVLITETYAWHDRNTDDESVGGPNPSVPASVRDGSDNSFDQQRRPRGAFFVELASPWGAAALEFDSTNVTVQSNAASPASRNPFEHHRADILAAELVSSEDRNGNGMLDTGEDANGNGKYDPGEDSNGDGLFHPGEDRNGNGGLDPVRRNRLKIGIDLEKTVSASGDPVWRVVSVRGTLNGGTAFGTDPQADATTNPSKSIIDPSTPGSTAVIDRAFYFARPPTPHFNQVNSVIPGGVFWQAVPSNTPLTPGHFRVVGTNAPFTPGTGPCPGNVAGMLGPGNKPATLSEPLVDAAADPYHAIMLALQPATMMTPDPALGGIAASWSPAIAEPLDSYGLGTPADWGGANVESDAFIDSANRPILMINGTHENFAVIHLQRLADPAQAWNDVATSPSYNPYVTVDAMPVDLNVVNTVTAKPPNSPAPMTAALPAGNHDDPSVMTARTYGRTANPMLSVQRGGYGVTANESDIWSRRVRTSVPDARDADAFLSEPATPASPNNLSAPMITDRPLPPAPRHTLLGQITGFRMLNQGSGYSTPPSVTVGGGGGTGFNGVAIVEGDAVVAIEVLNGGSGYGDPSGLTVTISGGGGSGALAVPIVGGKPTRWNSGEPYASLFWANRPFENVIELGLVPVASPFHLTQRHSIEAPGVPNDQRFLHLAGFWEEFIPPDPPMSNWLWRYVTGRFPPPLPPPSPRPFSLMEFIHVRSRFANLYGTVPAGGSNATALTNLGLDRAPSEQLSTWREPGRININTIVDGEGPGGEARGAWRALFGAIDSVDDAYVPGGSGDALPRWDGDLFLTPAPPPPPATVKAATSFRDIVKKLPKPYDPANPVDPPQPENRTGGFLDDHTNTTTDRHRLSDRHAYFRYQTMLNLAERVTTRSNVFAVWVTIGYFEPGTTNEITPVQRNRGFFIIDRSIPVAYERGQDHNVRDAIRLRRIIQ